MPGELLDCVLLRALNRTGPGIAVVLMRLWTFCANAGGRSNGPERGSLLPVSSAQENVSWWESEAAPAEFIPKQIPGVAVLPTAAIQLREGSVHPQFRNAARVRAPARSKDAARQPMACAVAISRSDPRASPNRSARANPAGLPRSLPT